MLTVYNVGSVAGSFIFLFLLEKMQAQAVLILNNIGAFVVLIIALIVNAVSMYFIGVFFAGFFLGVLFSVIVAVATRIGYERISVASSLVATAGGISDVLTPIVTGFLVGRLGVGISFKYAILMIVISIAAAVILQINTTEARISDRA